MKQGMWRFPTPGDWLQVSSLDEIISEDVAIGDKLYFRALSPMGFFDCYAPKRGRSVYIEAEHVQASTDGDKDKALEQTIPEIERVSGRAEIYRMGWSAWYQQHTATSDAT